MTPRANDSLPPAYFDEMYRQSRDPWGFESSDYEQRKYDATIAALPRDSYRSGLEIGCSIGVLTRMLAERCERLLAVDLSKPALERARERCRDLPHVSFAQMHIPREFPDGSYDLVVLSEVGYYWSAEDLRRTTKYVLRQLSPRGHLLLVHWRPAVTECPLTGDQVHELVAKYGSEALRHLARQSNPQYRLDLFEREDH